MIKKARGLVGSLLTGYQVIFLRVEKLHEQEGENVSFKGKVHFMLLLSTKFVREFNFANGRFLCFVGTNFCDWEKLVFVLGININFCYFQLGSRLLFRIITFSFFEYKQSNTGKQHAAGIKR